MDNIFINFLPPWVETGLQPAFYDAESGTVLQQTARMYAKVNELVKNANDQNVAIQQMLDYIYNLDLHALIDQIIKEYIDDGTFYETLNYNASTQTLILTFDIARS